MRLLGAKGGVWPITPALDRAALHRDVIAPPEKQRIALRSDLPVPAGLLDVTFWQLHARIIAGDSALRGLLRRFFAGGCQD